MTVHAKCQLGVKKMGKKFIIWLPFAKNTRQFVSADLNLYKDSCMRQWKFSKRDLVEELFIQNSVTIFVNFWKVSWTILHKIHVFQTHYHCDQTERTKQGNWSYLSYLILSLVYLWLIRYKEYITYIQCKA